MFGDDDKAIFKMGPVRHIEFAKITVLVRDSSSPFRNSLESANMAPRYNQNTIFIMASVSILNLLWRYQKTAFYVPNFVLNVHDGCVFSINLVFHISAFWLVIAYFGLNFDDFVWKLGTNVKSNILTPKRHILGARRLLSVEWWRWDL